MPDAAPWPLLGFLVGLSLGTLGGGSTLAVPSFLIAVATFMPIKR